jgi:hypothetical protein
MRSYIFRGLQEFVQDTTKTFFKPLKNKWTYIAALLISIPLIYTDVCYNNYIEDLKRFKQGEIVEEPAQSDYFALGLENLVQNSLDRKREHILRD